MLAAANKKTAEATKLIEAGESLAAKDNQGRTALHYAVYPGFKGFMPRVYVTKAKQDYEQGSEEIVNKLLDANADIDAQDNGGDTPLMVAIQSQQPDLVKLLLSRGASTSIKNKQGKTASDLKTQHAFSRANSGVGEGLDDEDRADMAADKLISTLILGTNIPTAPEPPRPTVLGGATGDRGDTKASLDVAQQLQECKKALKAAQKENAQLRDDLSTALGTIG